MVRAPTLSAIRRIFLPSVSCGILVLIAIGQHDPMPEPLPVSVAVTSGDLANLGGWPPERRWYAIALQRLRDAGAKRVFFDIAFPDADILHPESDDYFYRQLTAVPDAYIVTEKDGSVRGRGTILGTKEYPEDHSLRPFSDGYSIEKGRMVYTRGPGTITDFFLPSHFTSGSVLVAFPTAAIRPDLTFTDLLRDSIDCSGRDVVVYVDHPGVTSYIVGPGEGIYATTSLQLWTIGRLHAGEYTFELPWWPAPLTFFLALAPAILMFRKPQPLERWLPASSFAIWGAAALMLTFLRYEFTPLFYWTILSPVVLFLRQAAEHVKTVRARGQEEPEGPRPAPIDESAETLKELRYRLEYYERLSGQIPVEEIKEGLDAEGIWCHKSSPLVEILRKAERVAEDDIPVLIRGESGTGKEMVAQFIHRHSGRRSRPIIAVNCGALNDNLIEAELFGYERGSFTGAYQQKPGRFELADGGTLFLDEVSETSLAFQVKLLRVLQEGKIERVGGTKSIPVSVRIIAATHQDLTRAVRAKSFREDLYYRLNGYEFSIPPLRDRPQDVSFLFKRFLYEADKGLKYSEPLLEWLTAQSWPGNVRQLKAATQRAVLNAEIRNRSFLVPKDFELTDPKGDYGGPSEHLAEEILRRLRDREFHHRSISAVASDLMIHRSTVTEYLRGWTIRFMNEGEDDHEFVLDSLRGSAPLSDASQFRKRTEEYIQYVETRIAEGLRKLQSEDDILTSRFRNLPTLFRSDLLSLVRKRRTRPDHASHDT